VVKIKNILAMVLPAILLAGCSTYRIRSKLENAIEKKDHWAVAKFIEAGADVNGKNRTGGTPIMTAAEADDVLALQFLLKHGANINQQDDYGWTALCYAAALGKTDAVRALVKAGADVNLCNNDGSSPLGWAMAEARGRRQDGSDKEYNKIAAILKAAGAKKMQGIDLE